MLSMMADLIFIIKSVGIRLDSKEYDPLYHWRQRDASPNIGMSLNLPGNRPVKSSLKCSVKFITKISMKTLIWNIKKYLSDSVNYI